MPPATAAPAVLQPNPRQSMNQDTQNWYRVTLTDNWAKPTRWHGYVQATERRLVEDLALEHCPDQAMCKVSAVVGLPECDDAEILLERLNNATSPNEAILENGEVLRRNTTTETQQ